MLVQLRITDFAIIEKVQIEFGPGLTVLTGETGAGKSILIDALDLVVGGRGSPDFVRTGAERASIDALFDLGARPDLAARLADMGVDAEGELVVRRTIAADGRSRQWLNGAPATVAMLSEIGGELIDFYGQHEHQSLRRRDAHRDLLDAFGRAGDLRLAVGDAHGEVKRLEAEAAALREVEGGRAERLDFLNFQIGEIREAKLEAGEDERLTAEHRRLANAEKLAQSAAAAASLLYDGSPSASELLSGAAGQMRGPAEDEPELAEGRERIEAAAAEIEDIARGLARFAETLEADPDRFGEVEARIDLLHRLKRKHGGSVAEILDKLGAMEREVETLSLGEARLAQIEPAVAEARRSLASAARALSAHRRKAAKRLAKQVEAELGRLKMQGTAFDVAFDALDEATPMGAERVEFRIAPNAGETSKALTKIASGGELSRVMLAIKKCLLGLSAPPTLIFDEVDVGIGGETATAVGDVLAEVATDSQLLVITHLAQIAARADGHYVVAKSTVSGRTESRVDKIDRAGRETEIARMLGGERFGEATVRTAREMLDSAEAGSRRAVPTPSKGKKARKTKS